MPAPAATTASASPAGSRHGPRLRPGCRQDDDRNEPSGGPPAPPVHQGRHAPPWNSQSGDSRDLCHQSLRLLLPPDAPHPQAQAFGQPVQIRQEQAAAVHEYGAVHIDHEEPLTQGDLIQRSPKGSAAVASSSLLAPTRSVPPHLSGSAVINRGLQCLAQAQGTTGRQHGLRPRIRHRRRLGRQRSLSTLW